MCKILRIIVVIIFVAVAIAEDVILKCDEIERQFDSSAGEPFCTVSGFSVSHSQNIKILRYPKANMTKFMKFYDSRLLYVPFMLFDVFLNLRTLDVSSTQILEVSRNTFSSANNLTYLNMSGNNITQLTTSVFVGANNLMRLDLSRNKITDINENVFRGLGNLDKLHLSYNQLQYLHKDIFTENPYVETIALDNNRIEYIEPEVFNSLRRIRDVNLANNRIKRIHSNTFDAAYGLETLVLSSNFLNDFQLANKSILIQLNLDYNNLSSIFINATKLVRANHNRIDRVEMINSVFLESLELKNNSITDIHNITMLTGLLYLDLSQNPLAPLTVSTFDRLKRLRNLYLRATGITQLTFGMFSKQVNLETIDLSYNNLILLNLDIFVPYLTQLKQFYVDANNLTELQGRYSFSQAFPALQLLGVSRNHFNCSYLHSLLIPPNLSSTVGLHIEPESSDAEFSHIRDVSCVSNIKQTLQSAERELHDINELQSYLNQSINVLRLQDKRLQVYLLILKIALGSMFVLMLSVAVAYLWKQRRERANYFMRRAGGSIVFHSNAAVNTNMER